MTRQIPIPELSPRYEYLRELGRGGAGRVLLVRDRHLDEDVALKLLERLESDADLDAFRREFVLLSEMEHPCIARAYDFGFTDASPYFTSQFVEGDKLRAGDKADDIDAVFSCASDIAAALAFLHGEGVLHLDVKPSNIIVTDGAPPHAVLIDFGLVRCGLSTARGSLVRGSLPFMAPEYFRGEELGPWTDVYAFGVTFYLALTGALPRVPPAASDPVDVEEWDPSPRPPSRIAAAVPTEIDHILLKCLSLSRVTRFQSAGELLAAMRRTGRASRRLPSGGAHSTIGRNAELQRIETYLDQLIPFETPPTDSPSVLVMTGPRGLGQTHLMRRAKVLAQTRGIPFYLETGHAGLSPAPGALLRCLSAQIADEGARSRWESFLSRLTRPRRVERNDTSELERRMRAAAELGEAAHGLRRPFVLAVDGVQFWDEVSISLLRVFVRWLHEDPGEPSRVGLMLGYREEGPALSRLRELSDDVARHAEFLTLRPLGIADTLALYRRKVFASEDESPRAFELLQKTGGVPARIAALTASRRGPPTDSEGECSLELPAISLQATRLLMVLELLGRPASSREVGVFADVPRKSLLPALAELTDAGLVTEGESESGVPQWQVGPGVSELLGGVDIEERRRVHRKIARALARSVRRRDDPRIVEVATHARRAGLAAATVEHGLAAARYLRATLQNRLALEQYRAVLAVLPRRRTKQRVEIALEIADLHARTGEHEDGIELLKRLLATERRLTAARRSKIVLWLATLYARQGEFRRAQKLFKQGFEICSEQSSSRASAADSREERLFFLNEYASTHVFTGSLQSALELCDDAQEVAGRSRSFRTRELVLNVHATRANVWLRDFDYERAATELQACLEIAEAIGSPENQAVILNNLGIVHGYRDRYGDAIRAYKEAERISLKLDEGPSLVSIYGNLAILHAKIGDSKGAARSVGMMERLRAGAMGQKPELFCYHAHGVSSIYLGKYATARPLLEKATALAREIGDAFLEAFDTIYLAEAKIFLGEYGDALEGLSALKTSDRPRHVRRMAASRLAFLHALLGDANTAESLVAGLDRESADDSVPFLDAWDDLYLAWAISVASASRHSGGETPERQEADPTLQRLDRASAFFRCHGVTPALQLARWIRAERHFLLGRREASLALLNASAEKSHELAAALQPLLLGRILAEDGDVELGRIAAHLSEAGERFIGTEMREWSLRVEAVRERVDGRDASSANEARRKLACGLNRRFRERYAESPHWRRWVEFRSSAARPGTVAAAISEDEAECPTRIRTTGICREEVPTRVAIVAESAAMRRVLVELDRVRDSDLPVLIQGETGTGKELVARIVHAESPRSEGVFVVVDCSSFPESLVEVELFGARAGAFSDLQADRDGLMLRANGGTVLIDGVANLAATVQPKLLRVLSEGSFRPVGGNEETSVDVRFLFASSAKLDDEVREGRLRADLFHRMKVLTIDVPPLRRRIEDIPELARRFLSEGGGPTPTLDAAAGARLCERHWPGNVRQLRNVMLRLRVEHSRRVSVDDLSEHEDSPSWTFPRHVLVRSGLRELKGDLEREYIRYHLERLGGDTAALSRFMRITRIHLYRLCSRLGMSIREEKQKRGL